MPDSNEKPPSGEWEKPSLNDLVGEAFSMAEAHPRARRSVDFLSRIMGGGELPQPYADLLDPKFWDSLPTKEDLGRHGLGRGFGLFDEIGGKDWRANFEERMDLNMNMFALRDVFINRFGFAIPSRETIECIAGHSRRIVEIGAGTGFWARLLAKRDVDIVATDLKAHLMSSGVNFEVADMDGREAVKAYPDRDVLTCWPHMDAAWLTEALSLMQPGRLVFFVGESGGGCTGHPTTHAALGNEKLFEEIDYHAMVQFSGIHDDLYVYKRTDHKWISPKRKEKISISRRLKRAKRQRSSGNDAERTTGSSASDAASTSDT